MKNLILKFIFVILSFLMISGVKAQDCITFHSDYSGMEWDDTERQLITTAACELKTLIADAGVTGFKVHTFGFYGYNPNMTGGTEAVWNEFLAAKVNTSTPHLAIGKEINLDGSFKKFWVSFSIPVVTCFSQQTINKINTQLNENLSTVASNPSPIPVISKLKKLIKIYVCDCSGNRTVCNLTLGDILTLRLGFRKTPVEVGTTDMGWVNGTNGIYDYFRRTVSFNGGTYHIPEEVKESKAQYSSPQTITTLDTTITSSGIFGVVAVFGIESFYPSSNMWNYIQGSVGNNYNEAWVVLKDESGHWWLYSRYTVGGFPQITVDKDTQLPTLKDNAKSGSRTAISALQVFGNAAIDAVVQAVILRVSEDDINDWGTAFSRVNYLSSAWSGVSSLWPWKSTKSKFGLAILNGFAAVMGNALSNPAYTVEQAIKDFVVVTSASLIAQFLGPKILEKVGNAVKYLNGAFRMMSQTTGGQKVFAKALAVKCFLTGGCFVSGTPVFAASNIGLEPIPIEQIALMDHVAAHTTVNATYGLTASSDNLFDTESKHKDPYTSNEQRERDTYQLNDKDWYSVTFEQGIVCRDDASSGIKGHSKCQLALHHDWIQEKGYQLNDTVHMNLLEQGISGPFHITEIKHIIPQKIPNEDIADGYAYRPVTGLFTHVSDKILMVHFESGDSLGITENHPVYSSSAGGWKHAFELEKDEIVLSYLGQSKVTRVTKLQGAHHVYNLEVKELHNFLVGIEGVIVHNNAMCLNMLQKQFSSLIGNKGVHHIFRGAINNSGKAVGCHHISAITEGTARIVSGSKQLLSNGYYTAVVEIKNSAGKWVQKVDRSTFFPDNMSEIDVLELIEQAVKNTNKTIIEKHANKDHFSTVINGMTFEVIRYPQYNNLVQTAYRVN